MQRIQDTLKKNKKLLSIYFTAGYPALNDTVTFLKELEKSGVDMVEIGLPFSDPLADGPTIQKSSTQALKNGMTTQVLFNQLKNIRQEVTLPIILMGYFNPILQFGVENFCKNCKEVGIDGVILPDLPVEEFNTQYEDIFKKYDLSFIFLITPQTNKNRIKLIDQHSTTFIYAVSTASTTGSKKQFNTDSLDYFKHLHNLKLKHPPMVGFGIYNHDTFLQATQYAKGAIVGSAFINHLTQNGLDGIPNFINSLLGN